MTPDRANSDAGRIAFPLSDARFLAIVFAVLFLALPFPLFFWSWFKPFVAIPLIAGFVLLSAWTVARLVASWPSQAAKSDRTPPWAYVLLLMVSLIVLALCGVGGIFSENEDWIKHNAIFKLLIDKPWPPSITTGAQAFQFSYYIAWYLPATLVGKAFGWGAANLFLLLYSAIGLAALILLSSKLTGARLSTMFAVFLAFSGLDVLGEFVMSALTDFGKTHAITHEVWAAAFSYSGTISLLMFATHQAIAGWLLTALTVVGIRGGRTMQSLFFCLPVSLLWSPWIAVGLAPFGLFFVVEEVMKPSWREVLFPSKSPSFDAGAYISSFVVFLALVVFFSMRLTVTELDFAPPANGFRDYMARVTYFSGLKLVVVYVIFISLELAGIVFLLWWALRSSSCKLARELLVVSVAILLILPAFRYGFFNDFPMRVSVPAIYCLTLLAGFCLSRGGDAMKRYAIAGFLTICLGNALWLNSNIFTENLTTDFVTKRETLMFLKPDKTVSLQEFHEGVSRQMRWNFLSQYVGRPNWAIHRWLLTAPEIDTAP